MMYRFLKYCFLVCLLLSFAVADAFADAQFRLTINGQTREVGVKDLLMGINSYKLKGNEIAVEVMSGPVDFETNYISIDGAHLVLDLNGCEVRSTGILLDITNGIVTIKDATAGTGRICSNSNSTPAIILQNNCTLNFTDGTLETNGATGIQMNGNSTLNILGGYVKAGIDVRQMTPYGVWRDCRIGSFNGVWNYEESKVRYNNISSFVLNGYAIYEDGEKTNKITTDFSSRNEDFWMSQSAAEIPTLKLDAADASSFNYSLQNGYYSEVTFKRKFDMPNRWYSMCVPFRSVASEWDHMVIYKNKSQKKSVINTDILVIEQLEADEVVLPNQPYYVKVNNVTKDEWIFYNKKVASTSDFFGDGWTDDFAGYTFVMNYEVMTDYVSGDNKPYYYMYEGDFVKRSAKSADVLPTQWYFYPSSSSCSPNGVTFEVVSTGIADVERIVPARNVVFRLDGTRVNGSNLAPGIYIIDGVKRVVR